MQPFSRSRWSIGVFAPCLSVVAVAAACASEVPADDTDQLGTGGSPTHGVGGTTGAGRAGTSGTQAGSTASGGKAGSGMTGVGGAVSNGGAGAANGGSAGTLGSTGGMGGSAGTLGSGGVIGNGGAGAANGGTVGTTGGASPGGRANGGGAGLGTGGTAGRGNGGAGGSSGAGAGSGGSGGATVIDCAAAMPTGGTDHCGQNSQGNAGDLAWSLWSNQLSSSACISTFTTPAFSARWNNNSDFLARIGLEFGNNGKPHDQYGTIKADYSYKKTGSAGGYSYIGAYGWTTSPCVEWYIVDDRWGTMPFDAYNASLKATVMIDGSNYKVFQNKTNGTGGSRCSGVSQWDQYWSIRQSARQCGTITISDHFKAWEGAGLQLGGLLEAKILVETGGGTGDIQFPVANVTATQ